MSRSEVTRSFLRVVSGIVPLITFVKSPHKCTQRVNSTAITANDTAVRLRSLRNLNCSLVAGGADDPFHLVRAPNAQSGFESLIAVGLAEIGLRIFNIY